MNIINLLNWYHIMGVEEIIGNIPKSDDIANKAKSEKETQIQNSNNLNKPTHKLGSREIIEYARNLADKASNLEELKQIVLNFEGCSLKKTATNTVFADGNSQSEIMLIGEAPGANEDVQGIPFCGDSGKLLEASFLEIGYERSKLYITNSIFWRPPGNRRPTAEEIAICKPFVEKHIALVKPRIIILVGSTALASVLDYIEPISKIRQQFLKYKNRYLEKEIDICAIFHPSYLLRQPSQKKFLWQDLLLIHQKLNIKN